MPATTVTCPFCNTTLKPKTPVPGGTRIKCPKCSTIFVVKADDAEDVPPTVAAPPKPAGPRLGAPKPAASQPAAPRPAAPKPKPAPAAADDIPEVTEVIDDEGEADDEGAPAKPKKKGVPLWVWLVGGGVGLFLLCGCCGGVGWWGYASFWGGGAVSAGSYTSLKKGMSEDDVKRILGTPALTNPEAGGKHSDTWKGSGTDFITVLFDKDNKAVGRSCEIQNSGALKMTDSGLLPW
jgi:phage FluMu protein Com